MNTIIERLTGMHTLTDQVIAMDLLITAKSGVRSLAMAATEAGSPAVKAVLVKHLDEAIDMHERISAYVIERGWYNPRELREQLRIDLNQLQTALDAPML